MHNVAVLAVQVQQIVLTSTFWNRWSLVLLSCLENAGLKPTKILLTIFSHFFHKVYICKLWNYLPLHHCHLKLIWTYRSNGGKRLKLDVSMSHGAIMRCCHQKQWVLLGGQPNHTEIASLVYRWCKNGYYSTQGNREIERE